MNWQPIETAPKDGRWILLYANNRQFEKYRCSIAVAKWHTWNGYGADEIGWYVSDENCHEFTREVHDPTHWMPLPEPPQS